MVMGPGMEPVPMLIVPMIAVIVMTVPTSPTIGVDRVLTPRNIEYSPKNNLN